MKDLRFGPEVRGPGPVVVVGEVVSVLIGGDPGSRHRWCGCGCGCGCGAGLQLLLARFALEDVARPGGGVAAVGVECAWVEALVGDGWRGSEH